MIKYNFGIDCDLSWDKFLCLTVNSVKMYKQDFTDFSNLFYFIEHNKKYITHLLFDGYEYIVENGLLHNLYGPAKLKHTEKEEGVYSHGTVKWFYINGKLVSDMLESIRGCKNEEAFEKGELFFYEEITNTKSGRVNGKMYRRKEGIDYIKHHIDLKKLREKDIRKLKLQKINEQNIHNKQHTI